jgi:hypothetical protein
VDELLAAEDLDGQALALEDLGEWSRLWEEVGRELGAFESLDSDC